ncbi:hypothetical protein [Deinococcus navajonensis]|uniref:Ig-like domain-containing protein n=1 Tax=Deinococcus navajonensis TaxID=309884 RepID=A0ABV8XLG8_9DEIO
MKRRWLAALVPLLGACSMPMIESAGIGIAPQSLQLSAPELNVAAGGSGKVTVSVIKDCISPEEQAEADIKPANLTPDGCHYDNGGTITDDVEYVWVGTEFSSTPEPSVYDPNPQPETWYSGKLPAGLAIQWAGQPAEQQRGEVLLLGKQGDVSATELMVTATSQVQPGTYVLHVTDNSSSRNLLHHVKLTVNVTPPVPTAITGISASAQPSSIMAGETAQLGASLTGTGNFDRSVRWSVISGGGTLSSDSGATVRYQAPTQATTAVIRAASVAKPSVYTDVTVVVKAPAVTGLTVSATPSSVPSGGISTLKATVSGTPGFHPAVTWSVVSGGGTLSSTSGESVTLTAPTGPATVVVRATSVADSSKSATATVDVAAPVPQPGNALLSGSIVNWNAAWTGAQVSLETVNADHTGLTVLTSVPTQDGRFSLPLPVPATLDPYTIDFGQSCTKDVQPSTLRVAAGSLYVTRDGVKRYLDSEGAPHLAFLIYVDRPGSVDAQCTSSYTLPDGTVMTERVEYRYTFTAAGWFPVYMTVTQPNTTTTVYTHTSGPLAGAPARYVESQPVTTP